MTQESSKILYTVLLHKAVECGEIEKCKEMIKQGADVNFKNEYGYTPLYEAACRGHLEICKMLIEYGADVNLRSVLGWSTPPAHCCV